jgi:hypothetical protein
MILAASGTVTGLPALLIILAVLALIITGVVVLVRAMYRGSKRAVRAAQENETNSQVH